MLDPQTVAALARSFHDPADGQALKSLRTHPPAPRVLPGSLLPRPVHSRTHHRQRPRACPRWRARPLSPSPPPRTLAAPGRTCGTRRRHHRRCRPPRSHRGNRSHRDRRLSRSPAPMSTVFPPLAASPTTCTTICSFAFRAASEEIRVSEESHAVVWCHPAEFDRRQIPGNVRRAYRRILSHR